MRCSERKALWTGLLSTAYTSASASRGRVRGSSRNGERAARCFMQARGLSPLPPGNERRPIIRTIGTLRIRQGHGVNASTAVSTSPFRAATILPRTHFHELSWAEGPFMTGLKIYRRNVANPRRPKSIKTAGRKGSVYSQRRDGSGATGAPAPPLGNGAARMYSATGKGPSANGHC